MSTPTQSPSPRTAAGAGTPASRRRGLPRDITRTTYWLAVVSLVTEIGIIVTGGAVRLTKSGLGCPTWPRCTPESLTNTPEMGIHGYIEFGNRTLTFVVGLAALAVLLWVWNLRRTHPGIFWISVGMLACIPAQAVVGGITVLTGLNPWVVAVHFLVSSVMVSFATLLVNRVAAEWRHREDPSRPVTLVDGETTRLSRAMGWVVFGAGWAVLYLGTVVTGTGPHGGDADAPRHAFDPLVVTRIHALPVYLMTAAAVVLLVAVLRQRSSRLQRVSAWTLLAAIVYQAGIGYTQHFTGLPIGLVLLHMLGTGLVVWAMTTAWDRQVSRYRVRPAAVATAG
ncbi:heme A synthase [Citricoccus sp. SGAir0253]|uniref:COX15/CtaA family protein n=1 Tax=Citricoccus sp. SGAir0253 TaxID=2567881 RepID=UPI0010CD28CB|nr:COX15/CtaA family protein [Citricoccus sp. SGAir0253]QCU78110.1 heme A synthase [Citricoccus sp. SGAir0253]